MNKLAFFIIRCAFSGDIHLWLTFMDATGAWANKILSSSSVDKSFISAWCLCSKVTVLSYTDWVVFTWKPKISLQFNSRKACVRNQWNYPLRTNGRGFSNAAVQIFCCI